MDSAYGSLLSNGTSRSDSFVRQYDAQYACRYHRPVELLRQVLLTILPLFGLIVIGYIAKRIRLLHVTDAQVLNRLVVQVTLPAFLFAAVATHTLEPVYVKLPFALWAGQAVALGVTWLYTRWMKLPRAKAGSMMLVSTFGNTGFLGYPLTMALMPNQLPAAVILDQFGMTLWLFPGALILAAFYGRQGDDPKSGLAKLLKAPFFIALMAGILVRIVMAHVHISPGTITLAGGLGMKTVTLAASATIPVVLIAIGLTLRPGEVGSEVRQVMFAGAVKLAIVPVVAWAVARWVLRLRGDLVSVVVLEAAMPTAAVSTVFAAQLEMDGPFAVAAFFVLTLASSVTLPFTLAILRP